MQPASCPSLVAEVDEDVILAGIIEGFCRLQRTLNAGVLQPVPCRAHGVTGTETCQISEQTLTRGQLWCRKECTLRGKLLWAQGSTHWAILATLASGLIRPDMKNSRQGGTLPAAVWPVVHGRKASSPRNPARCYQGQGQHVWRGADGGGRVPQGAHLLPSVQMLAKVTVHCRIDLGHRPSTWRCMLLRGGIGSVLYWSGNNEAWHVILLPGRSQSTDLHDKSKHAWRGADGGGRAPKGVHSLRGEGCVETEAGVPHGGLSHPGVAGPDVLVHLVSGHLHSQA